MNASTTTSNLDLNLEIPVLRTGEPPERQIQYRSLTRQALHYGVCAKVMLEQCVLDDFCELETSLGDDTAGVILALLAFETTAEATGDSRLSVCLRRRSDGQAVEVDLMVFPRQMPGGKCLYLQLAGSRDLPFNG